MNAYSTEVEAFSKKVDSEKTRAEVYETETSAFFNRIRAYAEETNAVKTQKDIEFGNRRLLLDGFAERVKLKQAEIQGELGRVQAGASIYDGQARVFSAHGQIEEARVNTDTNRLRASIEEARTAAELLLKQTELDIQQLLRILDLESRRFDTTYKVQGQLAASSMSAVELSSSISERATNSASCTTEYRYDMTT